MNSVGTRFCPSTRNLLAFRARSGVSRWLMLSVTAWAGVTLGGQRAAAQNPSGSYLYSKASFAAMIGGENTGYRTYDDNALGFDFALAYQPHTLVGLEFRMGAYPISAIYDQIPITGGYRVAVSQVLGKPYTVFGYAGVGLSRSENQAGASENTAPQWRRCGQVDVGVDRDFGRFSWRVAQGSWRHTFSEPRNLRSIGLSTGVVYHFSR